MKNCIVLLFTLCAFLAKGQSDAPPVAVAEIAFEQPSFDAGDVQEGDTVKHVFQFRNTGELPLRIEKIITTCSCTAGAYDTSKVIAPGQTEKIEVSFTTAGKVGRQHRTITVISNAKTRYSRVMLNVNVIPKK